jgi:hypothetical protein
MLRFSMRQPDVTLRGALSVEVCRALTTLFEPEAVVELRVLETERGVVSGYFNNLEKLVESVAMWSGEGSGVYVTLNVVNPELLARAANRTKEFAKKTTSDSEILRRRWLPIDLDPKRPAGICATDEEHEAALERAPLVSTWLAEEGWPEPFILDSGNGAYLLYRIDLPSDDAATGLIKGCLRALDLLFGDQQVSIDTAVSKPAQLIRVPGTLNSKGDNVPERPHRVARILQTPGSLQVVGRDLLDRLAAVVPAIPRTPTKGFAEPGFDLDNWIRAHGLPVAKTKPWNDGTVYELEKCPWNPAHVRTARIIRFASGALSAGCFHSSCCGKGWHDLRDAVEPGWRDEGRQVSAGEKAKSGGTRPSQAQLLVALAEGDELFHSEQGDVGYATISVKDHRETWPLRSTGYRRHLVRRFYAVYKKPPGAQALTDALGVLESKAQFDGPQQSVVLRVGGDGDTVVYLDLANDRWEAVEITAIGWRVVGDPPVKFRRSRGMLPVPHPVPGGSLDLLRPYVNAAGDADWRLFVAWLLGAIRPKGPYAVLTVYGGHGSTKSSLSRIARTLLDPNSAPLRSEPRDVRDIMIAAANGWTLAFDNLSHLPAWLSDALCRLATGGGLSTRELYTDADETLFFAQRPILLNGIEEMVTRPDLLDRALILHLPSIDPTKRRAEKEFWEAFEAVRPQILGALCDAVSMALMMQPSVHLHALPRLADFAQWATAAEPALGWPPGTFIQDYTANGATAHALTLETSPVAQPVLDLAETGDWEGTASALLEKLNDFVTEQTRHQKTWPNSPQALSNALRRLAPTLTAEGVEVDWPKRTSSRRLITIRRVPVSGVTPVTSVTGPDELPLFGADADPELASPMSSPTSARGSDPSDGDDDHDEGFLELSDEEEIGSL